LICQASGFGGGRSVPWFYGEYGDNTNILAIDITSNDNHDNVIKLNFKDDNFSFIRANDNWYVIYDGKVYLLIKHK
jgi:hypothetical protein